MQVGLTNEDGSSAAHLSRPWGVALYGDRVFVADMDNHRVQVFDRNTGAFVHTIAQRGDGDGQLDNPRCDALVFYFDTVPTISNCSLAFVSQRHNMRFVLHRHSGVCVGGDNLYVAELGNHRVSVFSCVEFTFRGSFGRKGDAAGCFQVCSLFFACHISIFSFTHVFSFFL